MNDKLKTYNLINGNIITPVKLKAHATSATIQDGRIIAINNPLSNIPNIDLKGATAIPGFIDAHFHLKNFGKRLQQINLKGLNTLNQVKDAILDRLKQLNSGEWILGFGWDQNLWDAGEYPKKSFLNTLCPENPTYLTRIDGHSAWVNQSALKLAGTTEEELSAIDGGAIINGCIVIDNAMNIFSSALPKDTVRMSKRWIKKAVKETIKMGITGVHDAWQDRNTIIAIKELIEEGEFPIRCYGMLASSDKSLLKEFFKQGHYETEYLKIRSVKAFIDGALGSRGAALHEPYCDDTNNCGLILISRSEFDELVQSCYKHNFQLNTHAIGDRGNNYVLDAYSKVLKYNNTRRWRIEHAQMINDSDLNRFKNHSILPSMQPSHCTSDMKWADKRIGEHRLRFISRWKSFIDLGLIIPGGSDCPIETGNPLYEFYAAITRKDHQGWPKDGWQSQESIDANQALNMFTTWSAFGGFDETHRGKIDIGYDADLTILSNDILNISNKEILNTSILYTIVNGEIVYKKH